MGQEVSQEEKDRLDAENFVKDPRYMSWDENGNLRYGIAIFVFKHAKLIA